jgi:hypothetical protein
VIARSTIDLGRNLGLRVVAEGVETTEVWDNLAAMGCDVAQGYYLSPPAPGDAITGWLADFHRPLDPAGTAIRDQAHDSVSAFLDLYGAVRPASSPDSTALRLKSVVGRGKSLSGPSGGAAAPIDVLRVR